LAKGNVLKRQNTQDRFQLTKEDGTSFYVRFFNAEDNSKNLYQVTNQIALEGSYKNRFDVTFGQRLAIGTNRIETFRHRNQRSFNQINRYQMHSFWSNHGLFQYVQLFVISNGVNTKYLINCNRSNKPSFGLMPIIKHHGVTRVYGCFLNPNQLGKMIAHYIVINETHKVMMVLRPYQFFATEAIIHTSQKLE
jgi:type I restriction enzyme R subunit